MAKGLFGAVRLGCEERCSLAGVALGLDVLVRIATLADCGSWREHLLRRDTVWRWLSGILHDCDQVSVDHGRGVWLWYATNPRPEVYHEDKTRISGSLLITLDYM